MCAKKVESEICQPKKAKRSEPKNFGIMSGSHKRYIRWYSSAKKRDNAYAQLTKGENHQFKYDRPPLYVYRCIDRKQVVIFFQKDRVSFTHVYISEDKAICPESGYETRMHDGTVILHPSDLYRARTGGLKKIFGLSTV